MSVLVRPYRNGGWEVDVQVTLPTGEKRRARKKAPVTSRSAAARWGEGLQRELFSRVAIFTKEVPTLGHFAPRFLSGYAEANQHKPSGIASKKTILRVHLVPLFGDTRLDAIGNESVQSLKTALKCKAAKTVNNTLTVLNTLLKVAVEWGVIERMPCVIRLLKAPQKPMGFLEFNEFDALVGAAVHGEPGELVAVLLAGEAGLRCGEIMGLRWLNADFDRQRICVAQAIWQGHERTTKGEQFRYVKMTNRLLTALRCHHHRKSQYVLCDGTGESLTQHGVQDLIAAAAKRANVKNGVHILRHTFCSHLAMRGAPAGMIQQLAGHKNLSTTQGYMHLSPTASDSAIRLLDERIVTANFGDILETTKATSVK